MFRTTLAVLVAALPLAPPAPADDEPPPLSPAERKIVDELEDRLPKGSEGRGMLDTILAGTRMGPGEGWFATAVGRSRHGWNDTRKRYDADGDGTVSRAEFPGPEKDFDRLDRDESDGLDKADFDFSHALERTPGFQLFWAADHDLNGKVTREEFASLFDEYDSGGTGYLALDDLRDRFRMEPPRESRRGGGPERKTLLRGLLLQEIGAHAAGPALGEQAPDFELKTIDGKPVRLSDRVGERPVVLVFGNFTCSPFRGQAGNLEKLHHRYRDRAEFLLVYVREAHPTDGWASSSNERVGIEIPQPRTFDERLDVARTCRRHLDLSLPFLVDDIDDPVGGTYSGMPSRLYLLDTEGNVAYKSGRGPFGFLPRELEHTLLLLLAAREG